MTTTRSPVRCEFLKKTTQALSAAPLCKGLTSVAPPSETPDQLHSTKEDSSNHKAFTNLVKNPDYRLVRIALVILWFVPTMVFAANEISPGWERSYQAGVTDRNGQYMGGSETMHIVSHKGRLFAGIGYWEDSRNIWYGGKDPAAGWAQVLRLDKPGGQWQVDLEMRPQYLRAEILKSITFTTNGKGELLKVPANLLVASAYTPRQRTVEITFFTRDDDTGKWVTSTIYSGPKPADLEDRSVRAICVHRDKVTGIERIFISIGKLGVFSGVYDAAVAGKVRWNPHSESGPVEARPLAIVEAGGDLLFSAGRKIYRRNDGASPSYSVVRDMSDLYPDAASEATFQPCGGIRGLSVIPGPGGKGESLIFLMAEGGQARGAIFRLDPTKEGRYKCIREVYLDGLMSRYLSGNPIHAVLGGYNCFFPVVDPLTRETIHLVGFECRIGGHRFPMCEANKEGGFYAGGMYAIRGKNGTYRLKEINGRNTASKPPLVATRCFAISPFKEHSGDVIYFGGNDTNFKPCLNRAWIFSTSIENALGAVKVGKDKSKASSK